MKAYTLKRRKDTEEYHLFEGDFAIIVQIVALISCLFVKKMNKTESENVNAFTCYTDDQARRQIAEIGRPVCGVCTSHLYTTY